MKTIAKNAADLGSKLRELQDKAHSLSKEKATLNANFDKAKKELTEAKKKFNETQDAMDGLKMEAAQANFDNLLSLDPIKIRADGIDLEKEDLRVAESMYPNFLADVEAREENGIETLLPEKLVQVTQSAIGPFVFLRPEEHVFGWVVLNIDDEVLLMRSDDGQTYYLIERMVTLE